MRSRTEIKAVLEGAFRRQFPKDTVDLSDGYQDNIHVMVVSRRFDDMDEQGKQDLMWRILDDAGLTKEEQALISLTYPVSPSDIL